jgi:hypothetical protein
MDYSNARRKAARKETAMLAEEPSPVFALGS